jgi:hypothetical protein
VNVNVKMNVKRQALALPRNATMMMLKYERLDLDQSFQHGNIQRNVRAAHWPAYLGCNGFCRRRFGSDGDAAPHSQLCRQE